MQLQLVIKIVLGLISAAGVVAGALLPRLLPSVRSRGDRAMALQEVELLSKLDPASQAAQQLSAIIERRISGWHQKMFASPQGEHFGVAAREVLRPYAGPVPGWVRAGQIIMVVVSGFLLVLIIWAIATQGSASS